MWRQDVHIALCRLHTVDFLLRHGLLGYEEEENQENEEEEAAHGEGNHVRRLR